MRTILHTIAFSFKNSICKAVQKTPVLHSALKTGLSMVLFLLVVLIPEVAFGQAAASSIYDTRTGELGTTYSWIDCSKGQFIVTGDDNQNSFLWPFDFKFYDNEYTTSDYISVATNGFIRLDGTANTSYSLASSYDLTTTATELGQIIALAVYDGNVGGVDSWVRGVVTGSAPNQIMTIEFNNLEIDYNDGRYEDVQVSFYENGNKIVLKLGNGNIDVAGVDMGIHSGVPNYFYKWQEAAYGANNAWIEFTPTDILLEQKAPAASWNYNTQTDTVGSIYDWIDCSTGSFVVSGDDSQAEINWPFDFNFYDNSYSTADVLSVCTNGFIRLDDAATTEFSPAQNYNLASAATNLGQIIALAVYDGKVGDNSGWVRSLVTGSSPNRIFTIEYNNLEIDYNASRYADVQVSFYESTNKVVLKLGTDNITTSSVDMGLHSGVNTFFNKWQEVESGTNNTWIEYTPPNIEVNATIGTATAFYPTLKAAFDKINDGTHQGVLTIKINKSTTESASAVLNNSGSGSANYSSVNMYPTLSGLSINGNVPAPLIDLDGADNVTIDGRVNASGATKDLTIDNTSTASTAGTSTVRFINDATINTVKYCNLKGSETASSSGILFFSTTTSSNGNDGNTISNNSITSSVTLNRPANAIYSAGTNGKENSGNIISNNTIYDFFKRNATSNGILLSSNTTTWTIDGNSFYETASFIATGTVTYDAIKINNVSGGGFTVSNNYIGGSAPQCGGTAWTKTNATNNVFNAINLNVGTTVASSVQNNTIRNFNWGNSANAPWAAINVIEGSVNIGTVTGNTVGATAGTNSISVTGGTNGQNIYGIRLGGTGEINYFNNKIGSITGSTTSTFSTHIYGIELSGSVVANIKNNTVGSTATANSIFASSASTANIQKVYGIYTRSTGTTAIHENIISNLKNNTSNAAVGTLGLINGIYITAGTNTVDENTISNLSIANANTSTYTPSIAGIHLNTTTEAQSIHQNLIYNISNISSSFTGVVAGIFTRNSVGASAGAINANFIHSLSVASTGASIYGIYENTDGIVYSNNIITLGGSTSTEMYGIYDVGNSGKTVDFFFNTVYISGTNSGSEKSYALRYNTNSNTRDSRNNILFNARTGGTGGHYAIYYDATGGTFTANYNDYYVSGTGGVIGYYDGDQNTLALLQTATSQDANSLNTNPVFATPGGTNSSDYITSASLTGIAGTGITTDYDGITHANPPKMGALEFSLGFIWQGNTSTDFGTASNWQNGVVPPNGADISFAENPLNDCHLDQNRSLHDITNTSSKKLIINGKQLTLTGDIVSATANQIDATALSSIIIFEGTAPQSILSGAFVNTTINGLSLNNIHGLTQNGDITVATSYILFNGAYSIGANTLTLNGTISTTSGSLSGGSSTNIIIGGSGASTTLPGVVLNNLTLNRANGISLGGSVSVGGTLAITAGTLTVGANTLTISGNSPTRTSGNIDASNASSTLVFSNSSAITLPSSIFTGNINDLTINGSGLTAGSDLTVDGILNLQSANPSTIKGSLDMGTFTLNMGSAATTAGIGDVTGIIERNHTFIGNIQYSFGNQYTTLTFINTGTKPGWVSCKVSIGSAPSWKSDAVKREYSFAKDAGTDNVIMNLHYLDAELNSGEPDESKLVLWDEHNLAPLKTEPHGKSNNDATNNWVGIGGMGIGYIAPSATHDAKLWGLAYSNVTKIIWTGLDNSNEGDWSSSGNWNGGVPTSADDVLIPAGLFTAYPYTNSNPGTVPALAKTIEIEPGASITVDSYNITVSGSTGAWVNNGDFNAGTGKVIFNKGSAPYSYIVSIAGTTNFNTIEVAAGTYIEPTSNSVIRIAGVLIPGSGSILDFTASNNTIEYNGSNQTVINPIGPGTDTGYYKLVLSGSGTKTMPTTAMNIADELKLDGTVIATARAPITVGVEFEILEDATFATGNFDHTVGGPFDNRGTFIASPGTEITLNGTSVQEIYGGTQTTFEKLTINNAAGVDIITDITVNNTLTLTNGNLNIGSTLLTINGDITKTAGFLNVSPSSSLTFGGTTALSLASNLFYTTPSINNLTINRTGGVTFGGDLTVNGRLNLQSANPTDFKGSLDMGSNTITMGASATTTGIGDVTGNIKRTTILPNIEYTFGNKFSSVTFPNIGTLPTQITMKVSIGTVPTWKTDGIKRVYDISQIGGSGTRAIIKSHYLDSELNGNIENNLSFFGYIFSSSTLLDRGRTEINTSENWITLSNADFGNLPATFGEIEHGFGVSTSEVITWDGSVNSDWFETSNWSPAFAPSIDKVVIIPDAATTPNDPLITAGSTSIVKTLSIQSGGILNAGANSQLTVNGAGGAWSNVGTFNASTGKVIFNHGVPTDIVTVAGTTNFYDIEIGANTTLQPVSGSIFRIAGAATGHPPTSKANWSLVNSTVEWNGVNQIINNPQGIDGSSGFYNLILSGSGTKTMPGTTLNIEGDFTMSGTASATAAASINVLGNTTIESGTTFETGSFTHLLGGNFENNGTFTPTAGGTISFNGTSAQAISGTSTTSFDNLTLDNILGVAQESDININNVLTFNNGNLSVGTNTLGINGTVNNPSGNIEVNSTSSLSFGGTTAITLNDNLFNGNPTINNLTINRTGGVTLGNESMSVDGTLDLTVGTFTIGENTLTLAGNSPTRSNGNIDASNTSANLAFTNTAAITLPASVITGNINNLTVNGAGINAGSDLTVNGILSLMSANQSTTVGNLNMGAYTLNMGVAATTTGTGDVTGIVRREHTFTSGVEYSFGNQFTTIDFIGVDGSTKPTWVSCKIQIGTTPVWRATNVKRIYSFLQSGGDDRTYVKLHYLDSELDASETDEDKLVMYTDKDGAVGGDNTVSLGKTQNNTDDNWLQLLGMAINQIAMSSTSYDKEYGLGYTSVSTITWTGRGSPTYYGDWSLPGNWLGGVPTANDDVLIPAGLSTTYPNRNLLSSFTAADVKTIEIEAGASIESDGFDITVSGDGDAWVNNGTFIPGTGTVIFNHGDEGEVVTLKGTTNFNNLTIEDKTYIEAATNCITRIAGAFSVHSGSILDFAGNSNTVEYNGNKVQSVVNPGGIYGYHNLNFSGDGTKTLPESSLMILGDLNIDAPILSTGNTILMAGNSAQNIGGATAATLNNLTIDNASGVVLTNTALTTVSGSLLINSGKKFELAAAQKLTVSGSTINSAGSSGFILNSDATGTASLIHNTDDVAATVERFVSGAAEDWHFLSSPVSSQSISGDWLPTGTYGNGTGYDMYIWDEPTNCWIYKLDASWNTLNSGDEFAVGRGYLYSVQATSPTKEFAGNLNNGNITCPLTIGGTADADLQGFNLVGNPYPSSIDWMASSGWDRSNLAASGSGGGNDMWIWNPDAGNYGVYNSADASGVGTNSVTQYIAPMQGFFVRAESTGNMGSTNDVRVHDATTLWKSAQIVPSRITAVVYSEGDQTFDEVRLLFGYPENKAGAAKLFSPLETAPSLYLPDEDANFSIRYLSDTISNPNVPLSFKAGRDGDYTLEFNFNNGDFETVILEDKLTKDFIDLTVLSDYRFRASKTDNENRFIIHFSEMQSETNSELPAKIYSSGGKLVLDLTLVNQITDVKIVDVLGRTIMQKSVGGNTIHRFEMNTASQIFIVFAKTKQGIIRRKVFVH